MADPIDVSGTQTGGQRTSRSSRQRAGRLTRPERRVRDQPSKRTVGGFDNAGTGLSALAGSVSDFFGTAVALVAQEEEKDNRERDLQAAREAFNFVAANRGEAVRAVRSGDFSKLPQNVREAITLKAGFNELRRASGSVAAIDMADQFMNTLASDPSLDAEALQEQMLREELKGADDMFREAATESFIKATDRTVSASKQAEISGQVVQNFKLLRDDIQGQLANGEIVSSEDITRIETEAFAIGSLVGPETALKYREQAAYEIMKFAQDPANGLKSLRLLDIPNADGIRLADRYPDQADAAREFHLRRAGEVQQALEKQSLLLLMDDLQKGDASVSKSLERLDEHEEFFGITRSSSSARGQILSEVQTVAVAGSLLEAWERGEQIPLVSGKNWNKEGAFALTEGLRRVEQLFAAGDVQAGETMLAAMMGQVVNQVSVPSDVKQLFSTMIEQEGTQDLAVRMLTMIDRQGGDSEKYLNERARGTFSVIQNAKADNIPISEAMEDLKESRKRLGFEVTEENVMTRVHNLTATEQSERRTQAAEALLDRAEDTDPALAGTEGLTAAAETQLWQAIKRRAAANPNQPLDSIVAQVVGSFREKLIPTYVNGEFRMAVRPELASRIVLDRNGETAIVDHYTVDDIDELLEGPLGILPNDRPGVDIIGGEGLGLPLEGADATQAERARTDNPLSVHTLDTSRVRRDGGVPVILKDTDSQDPIPAIGRPGSQMPISRRMKESGMFGDMPMEELENGDWLVTVAPAQINDRLEWVVDEDGSGIIELVVFPPPVETPQEQRRKWEERQRQLRDERERRMRSQELNEELGPLLGP